MKFLDFSGENGISPWYGFYPVFLPVLYRRKTAIRSRLMRALHPLSVSFSQNQNTPEFALLERYKPPFFPRFPREMRYSRWIS